MQWMNSSGRVSPSNSQLQAAGPQATSLAGTSCNRTANKITELTSRGHELWIVWRRTNRTVRIAGMASATRPALYRGDCMEPTLAAQQAVMDARRTPAQHTTTWVWSGYS